MLFDFLVLNLTSIYLATVLLSVFKLNDQKVYFILIIDIILHQIPIITMIIIGLYYLKKFIFKYISDIFLTRYILIIIYYFIFGILLYGIYNGMNNYIFLILWQNLLINMIIYFVGIKYLTLEYN